MQIGCFCWIRKCEVQVIRDTLEIKSSKELRMGRTHFRTTQGIFQFECECLPCYFNNYAIEC